MSEHAVLPFHLFLHFIASLSLRRKEIIDNEKVKVKRREKGDTYKVIEERKKYRGREEERERERETETERERER